MGLFQRKARNDDRMDKFLPNVFAKSKSGSAYDVRRPNRADDPTFLPAVFAQVDANTATELEMRKSRSFSVAKPRKAFKSRSSTDSVPRHGNEGSAVHAASTATDGDAQ